jgi:hypothetical protein
MFSWFDRFARKSNCKHKGRPARKPRSLFLEVEQLERRELLAIQVSVLSPPAVEGTATGNHAVASYMDMGSVPLPEMIAAFPP